MIDDGRSLPFVIDISYTGGAVSNSNIRTYAAVPTIPLAGSIQV